MPGVLRQRADVCRRRLQFQRQFLLAAQQRRRHPTGQRIRPVQHQPVSHQPRRLLASNYCRYAAPFVCEVCQRIETTTYKSHVRRPTRCISTSPIEGMSASPSSNNTGGFLPTDLRPRIGEYLIHQPGCATLPAGYIRLNGCLCG